MTAAQFISILIAAVLFALVLIWDVETDYKKWKKNEAVNHKNDWLLRTLLMLPSIVLLTVAHPAEHGYAWSTLLVLLCSSGLLGFLFWLFFDGLYNLRRDKEWWFAGSFNDEGHKDAWLDKLQKAIGRSASQVAKFVGIGVFLIAYVFSFIK